MVQIKKLNIWVYSKNGDINDAVDRSIVWKFVRNTWTPKFLSSLVIRCPSPSQNIRVNCYLKRLVTRDSQLRDPDEEEENLLIGGDNVKVCKQKVIALLLSSKDVVARLTLKETETFQVNQ